VAAEAASEVAALGESVESRLGRRAVTAETGLTRRELEVMRHVAAGQTNKEIAQELFLSPRTVDMHVRNILRKLDCPSRAAAANRAGELGLLSA
jgi:DNA-binding NarL/FixJ family response regulator